MRLQIFSHIVIMLPGYLSRLFSRVYLRMLSFFKLTEDHLFAFYQRINSLICFHPLSPLTNTAVSVCCTQVTWELINPYSLNQKRFT